MKALIIGFALALGACTQPPDPAFVGQEKSASSTTHTAHFDGANGEWTLACPTGTTSQGGSCSASGGQVTDSKAAPNGWYCRVVPSDTKTGADLSLTLDCQ